VSAQAQLLRFGAVGLASNALLYLLYLGMTSLGIGHKLAMTLAYCLGVAQTFLLNRRWTFAHGGPAGVPFARYVATYVAGYLLNLGALLVLVDAAGYPHQVVQGVLIVLIAVLTFLAQKFWVFRA
jgi:putative flippase GtrA